LYDEAARGGEFFSFSFRMGNWNDVVFFSQVL